MKVVNLDWAPELIKEFCEKESEWVLSIPGDWSADRLEALYRRQVDSSTCSPGLVAEIVGHANTPVRVLEEAANLFGQNEEVASAIASNPITPISVLRELEKSEFESVREHCRRNGGGGKSDA